MKFTWWWKSDDPVSLDNVLSINTFCNEQQKSGREIIK